MFVALIFLAAGGLTWWGVKTGREGDRIEAENAQLESEIAELSLTVDSDEAEPNDLATQRLALVYRLKRVTAELESKRILGTAAEELAPFEAEIAELTNRIQEIDTKLER